jgi:hypothetical protein
MGYYWSGELLSTPIVFSNTSGVILTTYTCPTGHMVGLMSVVTSQTSTVFIRQYHTDSANVASVQYDRYTLTTPTALVMTTFNTYYALPTDVINTAVLYQVANKLSAEAYIDFGSSTIPTNKVIISGYITSGGGSASLMSLNVLCYVPPTATATPTVTPTPADILRATTTSGAQYNLERTVTYGDMAVSIAVLGLIVVILLALFLWSPRLRL